ncbi:hypothetical protein FKP32DRAFT_1597680 [Trametes sanguinea]|nr:hypothetical protein FKP32DRAFT_1597680 [Trametes sanguinea]
MTQFSRGFSVQASPSGTYGATFCVVFVCSFVGNTPWGDQEGFDPFKQLESTTRVLHAIASAAASRFACPKAGSVHPR